MFFLLVLGCFASKRVAIDLGSQYIKVAESTTSGEPKMLLDASNKVSIPAAISIKTDKPLNKEASEEEIDKLIIRFGEQALQILKRKPNTGFRFLPHLLARNNVSLRTSELMTPSEMMSLYLSNLYSSFEGDPILSIVVPSYWTRPQREMLTLACRTAQLPLKMILDDGTALAGLYASTRTPRFQNSTRSVIFVDVGGLSTKVTGMSFEWLGNFSYVNETRVEWSENVGGYRFAETIQKYLNISIGKAQKMVTKGGIENMIAPQLEELKKMIKDVMDTTIGITGKVDEIQVIGGASTLREIYEAIKTVSNVTVLRDFNANEAIAMGGVIAMEMAEGISPYPFYYYIPVSSATINVKCASSQKYCQKGTRCKDSIHEELGGTCELVDIIADERHIPNGTNPILTRYRLKNLTNIRPEDLKESYGVFDMYSPSPTLRSVRWCSKSTRECEFIDASSERVLREGDDDIKNPVYVHKIINCLETRKRRQRAAEYIRSRGEYIAQVVKYPEEAKTQGIIPLEGENLTLANNLLEEIGEGDFTNKTMDDLFRLKRQTEKILRSMFTEPKHHEDHTHDDSL